MSSVLGALLELNGTISDKLGAYIGAGAAMVAAMGTGAGQGIAAGLAAQAVARNPEVEARITRITLVLCAIAESSAIYGLIIAILLIFVVPGITTA